MAGRLSILNPRPRGWAGRRDVSRTGGVREVRDERSLREALAHFRAAQAGGVVRIIEPIALSSSIRLDVDWLTLESAGRQRIYDRSAGAAIELAADYVTVRGIHVDSDLPGGGKSQMRLRVTAALEGLQVLDCLLRSNTRGLWSPGVAVTRSVIAGNIVDTGGVVGYGIRGTFVSTVITGNTIRVGADGVQLETGSQDCAIVGNVIDGNLDTSAGSGGCIIDGNVITGSSSTHRSDTVGDNA